MSRFKAEYQDFKRSDNVSLVKINLFNDEGKPIRPNPDHKWEAKMVKDDKNAGQHYSVILNDNDIFVPAKQFDDNKIPSGDYGLELWESYEDNTVIYPSAGFIPVRIHRNADDSLATIDPTTDINEILSNIAKAGKSVKVVATKTTEPGSPAKVEQTIDQNGNQLTFYIPAGEKGNQGNPGKSAYQIWLDAGNSGTEQDFLKSFIPDTTAIQQVANSANSAAQSALKKAESATTTANSANSNAAAANEAASSATSMAQAASNTASNANSTAAQAIDTATAAQSAADQALSKEPDLTPYLTSDNAAKAYATKDSVPVVVLDTSNRTLSINDATIDIPAQVDLPANVDLSNYYNKSEVDDKFSKVADADKKYATKQELPDVSDLAKKSDLDDYAKKAMVPVISLDAEARKLTLNGTEINIPATVDLSGYATKQELPKITYDQATKSLTINGTKIELPSNVDLSGYYTKSEVDAKLAQATSDIKVDLTGYLTKTDASKTYATKSELPDLTDYAKMSDLPSITDLVKKSELANYATKDDLKTVTSNANRRAPTGYTLDRTNNPWTIWFDNGCGLQIPDYATLATIYGYGFSVNTKNTSLDVWPLIGGIMSASHGTLTLDAISKITDRADYWGPNTKVINPIRTDAGDYDWSNAYFNDESRAKKGQYQNDRQKVMLRVMYELGIWSIDDIKPFGLTKK